MFTRIYTNLLRFSETNSTAIFLFILFSFFITLILAIGLGHPLWGDEEHFVNTIRYFGDNFSLQALSDYDQVNGPLTFIIYALWGKTISFDISYLRVLSLLFSAATLTLIYQLYSEVLVSKSLALFGICILLLNPYMWGLSFFVFTDLPALLFLVIIGWAIYREQTWLLLLACACALLTKQYSIYFITAASIYYVLSIKKNGTSQLLNLIALIAGFLPLLGLMLVWKGVAPPSGAARWIISNDKIYQFSYLTTYISFMALYLSPIIIFIRRRLYNKHILAGSCILSSWYIFYPVSPSLVTTVQTHYDTVGILHRIIKKITPLPFFEHLILWLLFLCGLVLLVNIIWCDYQRLRNGKWDYAHFLTLTAVCFILIMPFSYQLWEKYLVSVLPFILLRLMLFARHYENLPKNKSIRNL